LVVTNLYVPIRRPREFSLVCFAPVPAILSLAAGVAGAAVVALTKQAVVATAVAAEVPQQKHQEKQRKKRVEIAVHELDPPF
jgi:hypothetical protein